MKVGVLAGFTGKPTKFMEPAIQWMDRTEGGPETVHCTAAALFASLVGASPFNRKQTGLTQDRVSSRQIGDPVGLADNQLAGVLNELRLSLLVGPGPDAFHGQIREHRRAVARLGRDFEKDGVPPWLERNCLLVPLSASGRLKGQSDGREKRDEQRSFHGIGKAEGYCSTWSR